MSVQSPGTIARIVHNAFETREFERAAEWFAPDAQVRIVATDDLFEGPDGYLQFARAWAAAFPDVRIETTAVSATADTAIIEYVFRGTHSSALVTPGGFIPPTWSTVELPMSAILALENGRIVRMSTYFDSATMLRQMGLLPNSPLHATDRRASLDLYATQVDNSIEQRNKAIVHRFVEEVVNQKNPAAGAAMCAPNFAWHGGSMGETHDLPGFQSRLAGILASFPDLTLEVHDILAEHDRVAVRLTMRGTQLGEFEGISATGRRVTSAGLCVYRIANDRLVEAWWQHDLLSVLQQLDAVPAAAKGPPNGF